MDVVYVIGTGSKWDNNELRYSLRSIDKCGICLHNVIIVGDELPDFVDPDKVTYLQCADKPGDSPARNVYRKIKKVFDETQLSRFLLSSDDHFFINPTIFDPYPLLYKGTSMPKPGETGIGDKRYLQTMIDTGRFMEWIGLEDRKYFEGHTNKLYTRYAWEFLEKMGLETWMFDKSKYGVSTNAPMGAALRMLLPTYPCQYRKDIKLKHLNTPADWKELENANCFSIYDSAIHSGVEDYLAGLFPDPCYFELQFAQKTRSSATKLS